LNSVKNCRAKGILPGAGASLVHASRVLDFLEVANNDQRAGVDLMKEVCFEPVLHICANAGLNGKYIG
jgi:chaperonin GroEL